MVDRQRSVALAATAAGFSFGYIAPEVLNTGKFTAATDVYAFGVVALETACGRSAINFPSGERSLPDWVQNRHNEDDLLSTADERLEENYDTDKMEVLLKVGLWCCQENPENRPSMKSVCQVLDGNAEVPFIPSSKAAHVLDPKIEKFYAEMMGRTSGSSSKPHKSGYISSGSMATSHSQKKSTESPERDESSTSELMHHDYPMKLPDSSDLRWLMNSPSN
ncbi:unnamed protein product [Calypogeia fissa]